MTAAEWDGLDLDVIEASVRAAWAAADGDSNDDEIEALQDALGHTPALIAEVRSLRARLAAVEALADEWQRLGALLHGRGSLPYRDAEARLRAALAAPTDTTKENQ